MFKISCLDDKNQEIKGVLDSKASPSEYFVACVRLLVDGLNGGSELNSILQQADTSGQFKPLSTKESQITAITIFVGNFHGHPGFAAEKVLLDPKYKEFSACILETLNLSVEDTSSHCYLLDTICKMVIPGIKKISYTTQFTLAGKILHQCNFPDDLIPDEFVCAFSAQVMDQPCSLKTDLQTHFDREKFMQASKGMKGLNPYTRTKLVEGDLVFNEKLRESVELFISKVIFLVKNYPKNYNELYKNCEVKLFKSETSHVDFQKKLAVIHSKIAGSKSKDEVSITALIDSKTKKNPETLYQEASILLNKKEYQNAITLFYQALSIFEENRDKNRIKVTLCYSALISCYRDLKEYDKAIKIAEEVISEYADVNIEKVCQKYSACLNLNGVKPEEIYQKAVNNYQNKKYSLAIQQLTFAMSQFDQLKNEEKQASCLSTLASCYRDSDKLDLAKALCEKALDIRKRIFGPQHKLTVDTDTKLTVILQLQQQNESKNKYTA